MRIWSGYDIKLETAKWDNNSVKGRQKMCIAPFTAQRTTTENHHHQPNVYCWLGVRATFAHASRSCVHDAATRRGDDILFTLQASTAATAAAAAATAAAAAA